MLVEGTDFSCVRAGAVVVCVAATPAATQAFSRLNEAIRHTLTQAARVRPEIPAGLTKLPPGPRIGPMVALGTQAAVKLLDQTVPVPPRLAVVLAPQQDEVSVIRRVAERATDLVAYIEKTITLFPRAPYGSMDVPKVDVGIKGTSTVAKAGNVLAKLGAAVAGTGVVGGLAYAALSTSKRKAGVVDQADRLRPKW